jgi:hypothetical protein
LLVVTDQRELNEVMKGLEQGSSIADVDKRLKADEMGRGRREKRRKEKEDETAAVQVIKCK